MDIFKDTLEQDLTPEEIVEVVQNADRLMDLAFALFKDDEARAVVVLTAALAQACAFTGISAETMIPALKDMESSALDSLDNLLDENSTEANKSETSNN
jgi:hypothetical protein